MFHHNSTATQLALTEVLYNLFVKLKFMIYKIPFQFALKSTLLLLGLIIVFHIMVLLQVIPYSIVWGGRLETYNQMLGFETTSILINFILIIVVAIKGRFLKINISRKLINATLWIFIILFSLNTIGNLLAKATLETILFTPVTFVLAIMCLRMVLESK